MTFRPPGIAVAVVSMLLAAGCRTVPVMGRKQLDLVSSDQEVTLGAEEFQKMEQTTPISHDPQANALVQHVGKRIAAVADLPNAKWEFVVFQSDEANAFCLPGGKVGVYAGILPITQNDAGLATVLGHEIAHAAAHHGAERMSQQMAAQVGGSVAGALTSGSSQLTQEAVSAAYGAAAQVGVLLPFSRKQEAEADHIGMIYMARAGYDPAEAIAFWQHFAAYNRAHGGSKGLAFLQTHPLDEQRIQALKQELPEAEAAYKKSQANAK